MIKILQRRFALSEQGAVDLIKGCIACVAQDISFMIPVGLLYFLVIDMMNGGVSKKHVALDVYKRQEYICTYNGRYRRR